MTTKSRFLGVAAAACVALMSLTACAAAPELPQGDQRVIDELAAIAPPDSGLEADVTDVECWQPSEHVIDGSTFRVLCRLHYEEAGNERYRDMICIGDAEREPVSDYCYRWAYYTDMPKYEDWPGFFAQSV